MKSCILFLLFCIPISVHGNIFTKTKVKWLNIQYVKYMVWSDDYNIKVVTSDTASSLSDLARLNNGLTAINGVFFCPADYSECNWRSHTINERFVNGEDRSFYTDTGDRAVFWWNQAWVPILHQTWKINSDLRDTIHEWLGNFPILFSNGKNMLEEYHDIWLYDNKMDILLPRHFICSNKEKDWIVFGRTGPISLDALAPIIYDLGCWDALNLDAGNSSKFIYNGRNIISSGRNILDWFVIERKWLDVFQLESNINTIMKRLSPKFKRIRKSSALDQLSSIKQRIQFLRKDIYSKNSQDILGESWEHIWYTLDVQNLITLKRVYSLNILEAKINALIKEIEN